MAKYADSQDITETNRNFYNALWSNSFLEKPDRFNTWPLISELLPAFQNRLEIGPGLRPRLPIKGSYFIDISATAIEQLHAMGGNALLGEFSALPFSDRQFDLVCAFDVIEHVMDDRQAFAELSRVLKDGGVLIISVPLHEHLWTEFDDWAGHARRYDPGDLVAILLDNQLVPEKSAAFGMQPSNPGLLKFGTWCLKSSRRDAIFIYNRVMLLSMNFQKNLDMVGGLLDTTSVNEIVLVCQRGFRSHARRSHV